MMVKHRGRMWVGRMACEARTSGSMLYLIRLGNGGEQMQMQRTQTMNPSNRRGLQLLTKDEAEGSIKNG
jgi:hypothetical protein